MKVSELISDFEIFASNEEKSVLEKIDRPVLIDSFDERERFIIDNLVKKSILSRYNQNNVTLVIRNANR